MYLRMFGIYWRIIWYRQDIQMEKLIVLADAMNQGGMKDKEFNFYICLERVT